MSNPKRETYYSSYVKLNVSAEQHRKKQENALDPYAKDQSNLHDYFLSVAINFLQCPEKPLDTHLHVKETTLQEKEARRRNNSKN